MPTQSSNAALTMVTLCNISYNDISDISSNVQALNLGLQVIWGPIEYTPPGALVSASLMYVVKGGIVTSNANEFTVVIRGTDFVSWDSWTQEDFNISTTVPFNQFVDSAPSGAAIAAGTATGLTYLLQMTDPNNNNLDVVNFIISEGGATQLNVTGHSLGGTLVPPLYTVLCNALQNAAMSCPANPFSFAGLTPGNAAFNSFFETFVASGINWRYVNPLDIAPNCWWSLSNIQNIYVPYETFLNKLFLEWGFPEDDFLPNLFQEGTPNNYVQPVGGEVILPTNFNDSFLENAWVTQAMYQHHSTTYMSLLGTQ
jgi:hypothetical protein